MAFTEIVLSDPPPADYGLKLLIETFGKIFVFVAFFCSGNRKAGTLPQLKGTFLSVVPE